MINPFLYYIVYGNLSRSDFDAFDFSYLNNTYRLSVEYKGEDEIHDLLALVNQDPLASMLDENAPQLVSDTREAKSAVVISGEYNYTGIDAIQEIHQEIMALTMHPDVISCFDLLTLNLYAPEEFYRLQEEINTYQNLSLHTMIFVSPMDDSQNDFWIHTRGMAKFGLPEISVEHIPEENVENFYQVVTFLINDLALGIQKINKTEASQSTLTIPLTNGEEIKFDAILTGNPDDPDFNNYHLRLKLVQ